MVSGIDLQCMCVYCDIALAFVDLSWGATRQVAGATKSSGPVLDDKTAIFDGTSIPLRKWSDWERSRIRKLKRAARRREKEKALALDIRNQDLLKAALPDHYAPFSNTDRDDMSAASSDDLWGSEIGMVSLVERRGVNESQVDSIVLMNNLAVR